MTWGLDVTGATGTSGAVTQVTETTQNAVSTVQQTASTVQTTVQTTTEAPAAAAEPVVNQVENTAGAVTTAPKQAVQQVSAPAKKPAAVAAPKKTSSVQRSSATRLAPKSASTTVTRSVTDTARKHTGRVRDTANTTRSKTATTSTRSSATKQRASGCDGLTLLDLLPAGLGSLLSVACELDVLPARLGTAQTAPNPSVVTLGQILARANAMIDTRRVLAAFAKKPRHIALRDRASAWPTSGLPTPAGPARGVAFGGSARGTAGGYSIPYASQLATPSAHDAASKSGRPHLGVLSTPVDGTSWLRLILVLDVALLGALLMWRVARRWLVPRFA